MALNDLGYILRSYAPVPDIVWVNDDGHTEFAGIQASGLLGTNLGFQARVRNLGFEGLKDFFSAFGLAAAAGMSRWALIHADENVMFQFFDGRIAHLPLMVSTIDVINNADDGHLSRKRLGRIRKRGLARTRSLLKHQNEVSGTGIDGINRDDRRAIAETFERLDIQKLPMRKRVELRGGYDSGEDLTQYHR